MQGNESLYAPAGQGVDGLSAPADSNPQTQRSRVLVNRLAQALYRECIDLIEQEVAEPADIDRAVRYAVGMRYASIGLLEYFDAVGYELEAAIAGNVYPTLCNTKSVQQLVTDGIAFGKTGQKTRQGLYIWTESDLEDFRDRLQRPFFDQVREWDFPTGTSDQ